MIIRVIHITFTSHASIVFQLGSIRKGGAEPSTTLAFCTRLIKRVQIVFVLRFGGTLMLYELSGII